MFAEERPCALETDRRATEAERRAEPADPAEARVRQLAEEAASLQVRVLERAAVVRDLGARHARGAKAVEPLGHRAKRGHLLDERDERADVRATARRVGEPRVALEVLEPEGRAEGRPVRGRGRPDDEVAVGRSDRLVRRDELVRRAGRARDLPGREVLSRLPDGERDRGLEHRDVDELSGAVALARGQRGEDPDRAVEPGREVGDRDADLHRLALLLARDAHEAAQSLHDDVERRPVGVRAVLSPAGDRAVDEPRVRTHEVLRVEAEVAHRAGPKVLDDDVGTRAELAEQRLAVLALQVEREAALPAVQPREIAALAVDDRLEETREVAASRVLDLHDIGAEVRELHPAERAGHVVPALYHPDVPHRRSIPFRRPRRRLRPRLLQQRPHRSTRSPARRHTPAEAPSDPTNQTSSPRRNTPRMVHVVRRSNVEASGVAFVIRSTVPPSPPSHVTLRARATDLRSADVPTSSFFHRPCQMRTVPASPTATTLSAEVPETARSVVVTPLGTASQPRGSSRYVTPPAPTTHADVGENAATP